jgi:REP element-mobilizing transposase RayT
MEFERQDIVRAAQQSNRGLTLDERKRLSELTGERIEAYLDTGSGECHLTNPQIAQLVVDALRYFDKQRYKLFAWCLMPNHVHVVLRPFAEHKLSYILHSWKSFTAKSANQLLGREGAFWQREYYDHLIRDEEDFYRVVQYIADNPARAGLKDWPWIDVSGATFGDDN